jgi:hypothetical protein
LFSYSFLSICFSVSGGLSAHTYRTPARRKTRGLFLFEDFEGFSGQRGIMVKKCMKEDKPEPGDPKLSGLLRSSRPGVELPPGFRDAVWRRIEKGEQRPAGFLERLAQMFLTPRLAMAAVTAVVVLAAGVGAVRGVEKGERQARDRYVASVDPSYFQR